MLFSHDGLHVHFSNKQTYMVFDRGLCQYISKVSIIMLFLRKMRIEDTKKKEAYNQEDEISEQRLQSHKTEQNG